MRAVAYRVHSVLRARWAATLALALIVAVVSATVISIAAGAQRTASAPARLTESIGYDVDALVIQDNGGAPRTDEIGRLPAVEAAQSYTFVFAGLRRHDGGDPDRDDYLDTSVFAGTLDALRMRVRSGRAAAAGSTSEFVGNATFAAEFGAKVGDTFDLATLTQQQADTFGFDVDQPQGPRLTVTMVGIGDSPSALDDPSPLVIFPDALLGAGDIGVSQTQIAVRLRPGADRAALRAQLNALPDGGNLSLQDSQVISPEVHRAVSAQSTALRLLALAAAVAAIVVLGQVVSRHVQLPPTERRDLAAIGFTGGQVLQESVARAAVPIVSGCLLGMAIAIACSGIFPTGFVRGIEPHRGLLVMWPATLAALAVMVVALLACTAASVALSRTAARAPRPSAVLDAALSRTASATASTGLRFAFARARGDRGSVRAGLLGVLFTVAGLTGAVTFGASLVRLVREPARYGDNFDLNIGDNGASALPDGLADQLDADPNVLTLTLYGFSTARVGDASVPLLGMQVVRGDGAPRVVAGRLPAANDEVALGRLTAGDLGVGVGSALTVAGPTATRTMRVTGLVVVPGLGPNDGIGTGAVVTMTAMRELDRDAAAVSAAIRLRPGSAAGDPIIQSLGDPTGEPFVPAAIVNVKQIRGIPFLLAGVLAVLAALTIAHLLLTSTRARRKDVAILRSLGADRAWVTRAIHWQATAVSILPIAIGVPVGFVAGRAVFAAFADSMGAIDSAVLPLAAVAAVVVGGLALSNAVATVPAWRARRVRPATLLQSE